MAIENRARRSGKTRTATCARYPRERQPERHEECCAGDDPEHQREIHDDERVNCGVRQVSQDAAHPRLT
jgi:hypothetical protein